MYGNNLPDIIYTLLLAIIITNEGIDIFNYIYITKVVSSIERAI